MDRLEWAGKQAAFMRREKKTEKACANDKSRGDRRCGRCKQTKRTITLMMVINEKTTEYPRDECTERCTINVPGADW